jgi:hypothetical protein
LNRHAIQERRSKPKKQIGRVLINTSGMYGEIQGIIGNARQTVKTLELPAGDGRK